MHVSAKNIFDARQMLDLLALRALDTKARRKLKIWYIFADQNKKKNSLFINA